MLDGDPRLARRTGGFEGDGDSTAVREPDAPVTPFGRLGGRGLTLEGDTTDFVQSFDNGVPRPFGIGDVTGEGLGGAGTELAVGSLAGHPPADVLFVGDRRALRPPADLVDDTRQLVDGHLHQGLVIQARSAGFLESCDPGGPGPAGGVLDRGDIHRLGHGFMLDSVGSVVNMSDEFEIRIATVDDVARLHDIDTAAGRLFRQVGMAEVADHAGIDQGLLHDLIAARRVWVVEASGDGAPVAFATTAEVDTALHFDQVSVDPDFARRGVGRLLMEHLIEQARRSSHRAVTLTTFRDVPWNAPYYARLGFDVVPDEELTDGLRQIRERERESGLDAWPRVTMRRDLSVESSR